LVHSATSPSLLNTTNEYLQAIKLRFPHSKVIFPNSYSKPRVAKNFGYNEDDIVYVPHAIDYCDFFGFHPMSTKLVDDKNMLNVEFICNYPVRLDLGKNVEFCVRIFAQLKKLGRSVRLVVIDFHSTGPEKNAYREQLKKLAGQQGLTDIELTFTSEFDESLRVRSPRELVRDMCILSNVFILPSRSETFSLVAAENFLAGCIGILNDDFTPLRSVYSDTPLYYKFSANIDRMTGLDGDTNVEYHPSVDHYCRDIALRLIYEMQHNRTIQMQTKLRMELNLDNVFRKYLEPLLYSWD
jgi:glycosyltransferase involved in cell wall biosynthesis